MAYTSKHVTDATVKLVSGAAATSINLIELAILFSRKGGTQAAFAGAVAHIVNPQTNKPYSVKLPFTIGNKLASHINEGREAAIETLSLNDAREAAAAYVKRHREHSIAMGAGAWDAWSKAAAFPVGSNEAGAAVADHAANKDANKATRDARAAETKALLEKAKAIQTPEVQRPIEAGTKVDVAAIYAAALELIAGSDPATLDNLGAAIQQRRERLATVEAERAAARDRLKGKRKAA